uniref:Uncharacterized protein n=1 Tax=Anguilla anguilla TaxID=7936 RepID=A0A0E9XJI8_ANGAN
MRPSVRSTSGFTVHCSWHKKPGRTLDYCGGASATGSDVFEHERGAITGKRTCSRVIPKVSSSSSKNT